MKITKSLLIAALAFTSFANAQEESSFSLSGEFRPRSEYFGAGGSWTGGTLPAATAITGDEGFVSTSVRAALKATYKSKGYTLYTSMQEVFLFGDRTQINAAGNGKLRVQEAWADINLGANSSLKLGRQPLSYDDQRILGGLGWAQQARTHDAAIFKYSNEGYNLDLGAALATTTDEIYTSTTNFSYRDMAFIHVNKKYDALNISLLGLVSTYQDGTTTSITGSDKATLITAGLHADYTTGSLGIHANAYIQDGNHLFGGTYRTVKGAYLASLDLDYKISSKFKLLAGVEAISGSENGDTGFFPLYGTNHKFNGYMDRFYVGNYALGSGLIDTNLGFAAGLGNGYALSGKAHNFTQESGNNDTIGQELDLVVKKKFNGFGLAGGYSQFFEGDNKPANAKDIQAWAWLMLTFSPKFL